MGISFNAASLLNGNGIDVNQVVSEILSQQSGSLSVWQQQQSDLSTQSGLLLGINNNLTALQTAVQALADPLGPLTALAATSSDPSILTASAQTSAAAGTHQIVVNSLATSGTVYTAPVTDANASFLPAGATGADIQLQVGGAGGTVHDLVITQGSNDTLNTLVTYINQQSTQNNWGVTASIVNDANGPRLTIFSQATGTPGALAITANTTTGSLYTADLASADQSILPGGQDTGDLQLQIGGASGSTVDIPITAGSNDTLNTLSDYINQQSSQNNWGITAKVVSDSNGYHLALFSSAKGPAGQLAFTTNTTTLTTVANPATSLTFEPPVGGTDASLTVDGISREVTTNTAAGLIPGVTLNLASADQDTTVQLTVGPDANAVSQALNNFVSAYNAVVNNINQQFAVDPTTNSEGPLGSDSALRSLQTSLLNDVTFAIKGNSGLVNLAALGINMNDDGTLTIGSTPSGQSLTDVLAANPAAFQNFFQNSSSTGFANLFSQDLTNLTDPTQGVLNLDLAENKTQQQDLTDQISDLQDRLTSEQQSLITQYSQVNATLEAYPVLLQEITAQLGLLGTTSLSSSNNSPATGTVSSG